MEQSDGGSVAAVAAVAAAQRGAGGAALYRSDRGMPSAGRGRRGAPASNPPPAAGSLPSSRPPPSPPPGLQDGSRDGGQEDSGEQRVTTLGCGEEKTEPRRGKRNTERHREEEEERQRGRDGVRASPEWKRDGGERGEGSGAGLSRAETVAGLSLTFGGGVARRAVEVHSLESCAWMES